MAAQIKPRNAPETKEHEWLWRRADTVALVRRVWPAISPECDLIVFLDGDGSDVPRFIPALVEPIMSGTHDFVIGSRTRGKRELGSMNPQQIFAGYLAGFLIRAYFTVFGIPICRRSALFGAIRLQN